MNATREEIIRELNRINIRLASLNGQRLSDCQKIVHHAASEIVKLTNHQQIKPPTLPLVGESALAAQLTVVTKDYVAKPDIAGESSDGEVLALLTHVRRGLP